MKTEKAQALAEFSLMLLLLGAAILLVLMLIGPVVGESIGIVIQEYNLDNSHAVQGHSSQAVAVRLAHNNCGSDFEFYHEEWDRTACVIEFDDEKGPRWGVRVLDGDDEVTAFIQKQGRTWEEFVGYMSRRGYEWVK